MRDTGGPDLITSTFVERDHQRTTLGGYTTATEQGTPPVPGLERVLKIEIPAQFNLVNTGHQYELVATPTDTDARIIPGNSVYPDHIQKDSRLQERLVEVPTINGPQVSGSGRQIIDVDSPLQASIYQEASVSTPDSNRLEQATQLLDAHERDHTISGSHAHTLLHHDTAMGSNIENMRALIKTIHSTSHDAAPVTAPYYTELYAMVAERRATSAVNERRRLDEYRRQAADRYDTPLDILEWLRDEHRLSYETITRLLEPGRVTPAPAEWVASVIHDLEKGFRPEEIPYKGSFWEGRTRGYEEQKQHYQEKTSHSTIFGRLVERTVETISIEKGKLVKEWWVADPPDPFPLYVIRLILHMRDLMRISREEFHQPLFATNSINTVYNDQVVTGYRYQDPNEQIDFSNPFKQAMEGNLSYDEISTAFAVCRRSDRFSSYMTELGRRVLQRQDFASGSELRDWLTGVAPTDATPVEIARGEFGP